MTQRPLFLLALLLWSSCAAARVEIWLPTAEAGEWSLPTTLPAPHQNVTGKLRCQQLASSPTPVWTLMLQPVGLADSTSYHSRDESGFSTAEMQSGSGEWIATARLPRLKWGPWLADLRGVPPALPDCSVSEVKLRLYRDQDRPAPRRARLEAVRCRPGDPLRQSACAH